jgi:sec-independent protein translocase protein TatA
MQLAFGEPNPTFLIIILVVVLLLFGGKKIPELMRGLGKGVKEFKDASNNPSTPEEEKPKN